MTACISCGATSWRELPPLPQAMLSDGRAVPLPLTRVACPECGLARHATPLRSADLERIFSEDYGLYAHPPGVGFERERQHVYANWLLDLLADASVASLFEVGCGNGSLLQELHRQRPEWRLSGVEPAPEAVAAARQARLDVREGYAGAEGLPDVADAVLAINTAEHVEDPVAFLRMLRSCVAPGGRLVIICPDGDKPSTELLIYDHVHSFSRRALYHIARGAGLTVLRQDGAPAALGAFQALVMVTTPGPGCHEPTLPDALTDRRYAYLLAWRELDGALLARCPAGARIEAFGAGEAANLLRAYAPRTWARVAGVMMDGGSGAFGGLPVHDYASLKPEPQRALLLAVRAGVQPVVAARLEADGHAIIRWDDLVPSGGSP